MIDKRKRQTLFSLSMGMIASALPFQAMSAAAHRPTANSETHSAFGRTGELANVEITVSTLGIGSAVTTITNRSTATVTVTKIGSGIVQHKNGQYDLNAAVGSAGVSLKPGQRRILVARRLSAEFAMA